MRTSSTLLVLTNARSTPMTIILEPWGREWAFPAGASVEVKEAGEGVGNLEWRLGDHDLTIFGRTGTVVSVVQDGVEVM